MIFKEVKTDGKIYKICICQNDKGKFQYVNLTNIEELEKMEIKNDR